MNILPKKSWHVRTKRNIDRVRRDELKAKKDEEELQRRIQLAEQESRIDLLRKRAKANNDQETNIDGSLSDHRDGQTVDSFDKIRFDLFGDVADGKGDTRINKDHEREAKDEQEKHEKQIGILTYLGQSELDSKTKRPWYLESHERRMNITETECDAKESNAGLKDSKIKQFHDPLNDMKRYMDQMRNKNEDKHKDQFKKGKKTEKGKDKKKRKKHKRKSSRKSSSSESDDPIPRKVKTIEELREERLQREKVERERSRQLFVTEKSAVDVILDDRQRKYNSQFNPHLARQNK